MTADKSTKPYPARHKSSRSTQCLRTCGLTSLGFGGCLQGVIWHQSLQDRAIGDRYVDQFPPLNSGLVQQIDARHPFRDLVQIQLRVLPLVHAQHPFRPSRGTAILTLRSPFSCDPECGSCRCTKEHVQSAFRTYGAFFLAPLSVHSGGNPSCLPTNPATPGARP